MQQIGLRTIVVYGTHIHPLLEKRWVLKPAKNTHKISYINLNTRIKNAENIFQGFISVNRTNPHQLFFQKDGCFIQINNTIIIALQSFRIFQIYVCFSKTNGFYQIKKSEDNG